HASVPRAALADQRLHDLMALVDVLRVGQVRARKAAEGRLAALLGPV
ncbi:MAG: MarR family transcriptional regulator, partial [Myxococcales bacterium]|nr:MarR family transcriptional regulator [Myxococcales bacterium]